jgi:hypothetical protein
VRGCSRQYKYATLNKSGKKYQIDCWGSSGGALPHFIRRLLPSWRYAW